MNIIKRYVKLDFVIFLIVPLIVLAMSIFGVLFSNYIEQREFYNEYTVNKLKETSYFLIVGACVMIIMLLWRIRKFIKYQKYT